MRRIVSQSLNSVQVVKDEGEVVEMSKDLVRHETRCYVPVGRGSHVGIYCYRKQVQWQSMMPLELWDQTPF